MTQTNILELAKQGDPRAIAAHLTRQLQPLGTSVKAALKDGCLQLMLESEQVPDQQDVMEIVRDGITSLEAESIQKVKVYGRQTGEKSPTWAQEFDVEPKAEFPSFSFGSDADEPNEYQNNYYEEDVASRINEEPEFSDQDENNSSQDKDVKFAPVAGGLKSLKAAPSKVKLMVAGGLATLVIAGGAIYKFTSGGEEAATETPPTPVAVAKPASTATKAKDTKAKPIPAASTAAKPQPSPTAAKAKPTPAAATAAKPQPSPTAAAKAKPTPVAATPAKPQPTATTAAKPASVATNSQANAMQQAVNKAQKAANLVQSAKSKQQWQAVAAEWQDAIALMQSVPKTHPKYQLAQQRVGQYQQFLAYAQQNAKR